MGDEHLSTIPETESDEVIKSRVENLVPIPSESKGTSDDTCDLVGYFIPSEDSLGSGLEVSSGTRNKIFDPGIFFEDCPNFEDSHARCFVHRSLALQILRTLILGIRYPNLID
ncbi:hypothetical protein Tco_0396347 [Tanacetum coccineum]